MGEDKWWEGSPSLTPTPGYHDAGGEKGRRFRTGVTNDLDRDLDNNEAWWDNDATPEQKEAVRKGHAAGGWKDADTHHLQPGHENCPPWNCRVN